MTLREYLEDSVQVGKVGTCQLTRPPLGRVKKEEEGEQ